ncbi:MAG: PmoA family protein [Anditalea sp.]
MNKKNMIRSAIIFMSMFILSYGCGIQSSKAYGQGMETKELRIEQDENAGTISVFRFHGSEPVLTQNAREDVRPYIHPIVAPDGKGLLTEYRPKHHLHQTGLYWGLKLVNGRDYFMNWQGDYWRRISANVVEGKGQEVKWQTVYDLLDEKGSTILTETQNWSMREQNGKYILDLEWSGEAKTDITLGKFYVGGLFLRMPWHKGVNGEVVNAVGQQNNEAEGQRAIWTDVGIQLEGRDDMAHIAILDHPDNRAFPTPWRVDNELGVGPSIQILGDWKIPKGETEVIRYRLVAYTGDRTVSELTRAWKEFVCKH